MIDDLKYSYTDKHNRLEKIREDLVATTTGDDLYGTSTYKYDEIGNLIEDRKVDASGTQLSPDGSKLVYYNKLDHICGFDYTQTSMLLFALDKTRKRATSVDEVFMADVAYGKQAADLTMQGGNTSVVASKLDLVNTNGSDLQIWSVPLTDDKLTDPQLNATPGYGDVRRGTNYQVWIPVVESTTAREINDGAVTSPAFAMDDYLLSGALPGQIVQISDPTAATTTFSRHLGTRKYEIKDHLGNVRVVINDYKTPNADGTHSVSVASATDYFPFGMTMPKRDYKPGYRFGFNGMEKDDAVYGEGNWYDFGARPYNPLIGRFPSPDPDAAKYPFQSSYCFANNTPIMAVDKDGKGAEIVFST